AAPRSLARVKGHPGHRRDDWEEGRRSGVLGSDTRSRRRLFPRRTPGRIPGLFPRRGPGRRRLPGGEVSPRSPADCRADAARRRSRRRPVGRPHREVDAAVVRWEARTGHDRFNEMEIIATHAEGEAFLADHPGQPFYIFPESREHSVRMFDHLPELWLTRTDPPEFSVRPNEFCPFQLGVWAGRGALENLRVTFSDFASSTGARIPAAALRCLQTSGTNWDNQPIV